MSLEMREKYAKGVCSSEYVRTGTPRFGSRELTQEEWEEIDILCNAIESKADYLLQKDILPRQKAEKKFDEIIGKLNQNAISKGQARRSAESALMEYLEMSSLGGDAVEKYFKIKRLCRGGNRSKSRKEKK